MYDDIIKCAILFYEGNDQDAWQCFIKVVDQIMNLNIVGDQVELMEDITRDFSKIEAYKKSMNYPLIADLLYYNIANNIKKIEGEYDIRKL